MYVCPGPLKDSGNVSLRSIYSSSVALHPSLLCPPPSFALYPSTTLPFASVSLNILVHHTVCFGLDVEYDEPVR